MLRMFLVPDPQCVLQVFGYRGVILFPWLARVYDRYYVLCTVTVYCTGRGRDIPSKPPATGPPRDRLLDTAAGGLVCRAVVCRVVCRGRGGGAGAGRGGGQGGEGTDSHILPGLDRRPGQSIHHTPGPDRVGHLPWQVVLARVTALKPCQPQNVNYNLM